MKNLNSAIIKKILFLAALSFIFTLTSFAQGNPNLQKGQEFLANENLEGANKEFSQCIATEKKAGVKSQCYLWRAEAQIDSKLRLKDINSALRLAPNSDEIYVKRGQYYFGGEDYINSLPDFKKALKLNPKNAKAHFFLGQINDEYGKPEAAIKSYSEAIRLKCEFKSTYLLRGEVYLQSLEDYDKAIADFNKYIELEPTVGDGYLARGNAYQRKGDKAKAKADYEMLLKLEVYANLGTELLADLNLSKAEFLTKANEYFQEGDNEATIAFLNSFPEFAEDVKVIELKANAYQEMGKTKKAAFYFHKLKAVK